MMRPEYAQKYGALTQRSFPSPKPLCFLVRGQVIRAERDFLRLEDAQDVFYTTGDQSVLQSRSDL